MSWTCSLSPWDIETPFPRAKALLPCDSGSGPSLYAAGLGPPCCSSQTLPTKKERGTHQQHSSSGGTSSVHFPQDTKEHSRVPACVQAPGLGREETRSCETGQLYFLLVCVSTHRFPSISDSTAGARVQLASRGYEHGQSCPHNSHLIPAA